MMSRNSIRIRFLRNSSAQPRWRHTSGNVTCVYVVARRRSAILSDCKGSERRDITVLLNNAIVHCTLYNINMNWIELIQYKVQSSASLKEMVNVRYAKKITNRGRPVPCSPKASWLIFLEYKPTHKNILGFICDPSNTYTVYIHTHVHTQGPKKCWLSSRDKKFSPDISSPRLSKPFTCSALAVTML
jgi:hypothetical protein